MFDQRPAVLRISPYASLQSLRTNEVAKNCRHLNDGLWFCCCGLYNRPDTQGKQVPVYSLVSNV